MLKMWQKAAMLGYLGRVRELQEFLEENDPGSYKRQPILIPILSCNFPPFKFPECLTPPAIASQASCEPWPTVAMVAVYFSHYAIPLVDTVCWLWGEWCIRFFQPRSRLLSYSYCGRVCNSCQTSSYCQWCLWMSIENTTVHCFFNWLWAPCLCQQRRFSNSTLWKPSDGWLPYRDSAHWICWNSVWRLQEL